MTSMKVLADSLLEQENLPVEMYQEFMGDIAKEIDRENKIITDLLSLVKMDKKGQTLNIESVNINELLEQKMCIRDRSKGFCDGIRQRVLSQ